MIVLNPFLDSLCNFGLKNIGLTPGTGSGCFQSSQDIVSSIEKIQKTCRKSPSILNVFKMQYVERLTLYISRNYPLFCICM